MRAFVLPLLVACVALADETPKAKARTLCKEGEAVKLLHDGDTTLGGRVPVNPSGGLACFGEAVPAQAIAQVCESSCGTARETGRRSPG